MSPEGSALGAEADAHSESTRVLTSLLDAGVAMVGPSPKWCSRHVLGGVRVDVLANSYACGSRLTRCLLSTLAGDDAAALTVFVIDGGAPGAAVPPPWNLPHSDRRHLERLHLSPDGALSAAYHHDFRYWMITDQPGRRALLWFAEQEQLPCWESAAPFKLMFQWFVSGSNKTLVHGGVVGNGNRGALLVGAGGSGKSTTVGACLGAGLGVCGDDLVAIERHPTHWLAHAAYDAIKLSPDGGVAFPGIFADAPFWTCGEKRVMRYTDARPEGLLPSTRIDAVIWCSVANLARSELVAIPQALALRAVGPPTAFLLRGREAHILQMAGALVRSLPCMQLRLGGDPAEAAAVLREWLEAA